MKDGLSNYPGRYWGNKPQLDASSGQWPITNNSPIYFPHRGGN